MRAPGSGIWINLGTTKAYKRHRDVFSDFTECPYDTETEEPFRDVCPCVKEHALHSVQFLAHDDEEWGCPGLVPGGRKGLAQGLDNNHAMNMEIVMCKLDGGKTCGGRADTFRAGWMASQACDCQEEGFGRQSNCKNTQVAPR